MITPSFYNENKVGTLYNPDVAAAMTEGQALGLAPASSDSKRVVLMLVDPQVDFIHVDGTLSVPGAINDTKRTIDWILTNINELTAIAGSLDAHIPFQIFFPSWWEDKNGVNPPGFTMITAAQVASGEYRPLIEKDWSRKYVAELEAGAKKSLMIWPYHTMIGTPGQSVTPALYEIVAFHSAARATQPTWLTKGNIPKAEFYSPLEPEVKVPNHPQGGLNTAFLQMLTSYDLVYVAGQAKSHCVLELLKSIFNYFGNDVATLSKIRILTDCMSVIRGFEDETNREYAKFAARGAQLVLSTDPIK